MEVRGNKRISDKEKGKVRRILIYFSDDANKRSHFRLFLFFLLYIRPLQSSCLARYLISVEVEKY